MKKILSIILVIAMIVIPLSSCDKQNDNVIKLNEVTHSVFYAPQYLAIALGYFEEQGITLELTNGNGANNVMTAILAGQADIGLCGPEAAVYINVSLDTSV